MAEPKEKSVGSISAVVAEKTSASGWRKYKVTFAGESEPRKMDIPPDVTYEPKVGDTITVWPGKFNSWTLDKTALPSAAPAVQSSSDSGSKSAPSGNGHSGGDNKFRDPKVIELQEWVKIFTDLYIACIPGLDPDNTPNTVEDVDAIIDQIVAKAKVVQGY